MLEYGSKTSDRKTLVQGTLLMYLSKIAATGIGARLKWYLLKLPLTVVLIAAGFIFEAIISWPFALLCWLHTRHLSR
jgi:hypothetical protein